MVCQWGWGVLECLIQVMMEDDRLLEATPPRQVWTNRSSPGDGRSDRKRETCTDASCRPFSDCSSVFLGISISQNSHFCDIQYN